MKKVIIAILLSTLFQFTTYAQADGSQIKNIRTANDVNNFIHSLGGMDKYRYVNQSLQFPIKLETELANAQYIRSWYIADLDGDGTPDLLVMLKDRIEPMYVLNNGKVHNGVSSLWPWYVHDHSFARVDTIGKDICTIETTIETNVESKVEHESYYDPDHKLHKDTTYKAIIDTLIYKYGGFVEYNPAPEKLNIERITVSGKYNGGGRLTVMGYLTINSNHHAQDGKVTKDTIVNPRRVKPRETIIDDSSYAAIVGLINYLNFDHFVSKHRIERLWDVEESSVEIEYDGKTITLNNYGNHFGIDQLYRLFNKLDKSQKWTVIN